MQWFHDGAPIWIALFGYLAATLTAAATGALFQPGVWYRTLSKPAWTPPDALFPIAWTILYLCMAIAAWWVGMSNSIWTLPALALWAWQLVLNALWSPVFFGLRRIGTALAVISFLWIAVAATLWLFFQVSLLAGWLMVPYLVWITYAAALNLSIRLRNPLA